MGVYDEFGEKYIQIKAGHCCMAHYNIGDETPLEDGVYLAYEGIVIILDKIFIACFNNDQLREKWGGAILIDLDEFNPIANAIKAIKPCSKEK